MKPFNRKNLMTMNNNKEELRKLLDNVFELEGLLHLALSRDEENQELLNLIDSKIDAVASFASEKDDGKDEVVVEVEQIHFDDGEVTVDEEVVDDERIDEETDLEEDDEFSSYALSDEDEEEVEEKQESLDETSSEMEKPYNVGTYIEDEIESEGEEVINNNQKPENEGLESVSPTEENTVSENVEEVAAGKGQLKKRFSLNDMFRFSYLFGGRQQLVEMLDNLDKLSAVQAEDYLRKNLSHSDEELKEEFIEKVITEKS